MSENPLPVPAARTTTLWIAVGGTVFLLAASIAAGWVGSMNDPSIGESLMALFQNEIAGQISIDHPVDLCVKLFANNFEACILLFLGGASIGLLTLAILGINGIVIGAVTQIVSQTHSALYLAAALVPHGIFEIPAFIISASLGFVLAQALIAEWYGAGDAATEAQKLGKLFLCVVLPLIAVAAVVEAFITPAVLQMVA
ncbi:MAG: stage II sporulation protein M [Methanoregula sp.]|jgi:stage II sporulation protein M